MPVSGGKARTTAFWKGSPIGPDGLLSALACILGHHTIVLAASANDNGLLHQELVDFELPPPLGWPAATGMSTNDVGDCLAQRSFAFTQDDAKRGTSAQSLRRVQMVEHWRATGKFRVPTSLPPPLGDDLHRASSSGSTSAPCTIAFGHGDAASGDLAACRGPKVRVPRPTAAKACYAWCNGTLSQHALSHASLGHVRHRVE